MSSHPAPVRASTDPLPKTSPRANLLSSRGNYLTAQSPMSKVSSTTVSPHFETTVSGVRKLPSIGDFVAVGSSRPSSSRARSNLSINTVANDSIGGLSIDFEEEGVLTPSSMLRYKSKASISPLSRQQFESMFFGNSRSKPPSPEAFAVRAPIVSLPSSSSPALQIFKIAEDSDEKAEADVVVPPGAEDKACYHILDEDLSDLDDEAGDKTPSAKHNSTAAEQKSSSSSTSTTSNMFKLPSISYPRSGEEKTSVSIPCHDHYKQQRPRGSPRSPRGSPPLFNLLSSDSKAATKGSPPIPVLHKKDSSPPSSKILPNISPQHDAPVRSPSLLLTERSSTPEREEADRSSSNMRRSQSHS